MNASTNSSRSDCTDIFENLERSYARAASFRAHAEAKAALAASYRRSVERAAVAAQLEAISIDELIATIEARVFGDRAGVSN